MTVKRLPAEVFHPAEYIRDELEARDWTKEQFCAMCRLPARKVLDLIDGRADVTPCRAMALSQVFGTSATLWYRIQRTFDAGPGKDGES